MDAAVTDEAKTQETAAVLARGTQLGGWTIVRLLGKGGMAEVYEVEDGRLGTRYALKLFTYARGEAAAARARFIDEAKMLSKLDHPRLVRVYDYGEENGRLYFVMNLVLSPDGRPQTLADVDAARTAGNAECLLDEEQVALWYEDLRDGLAYIHGKGILHRDLKLQNVLVGPDGHVVISDFGIAKIFDRELCANLGVQAEQTYIAERQGRKTMMGSVGYLAPEVEMGVAASKESDWYALGVIIFRLLTGVWCDARTNVADDLESFTPVWMQILPKLLHLNPNGRECPSYRELERAYREEAAFQAEQAYEKLRSKRHDAVRGRRNAWAVVLFVACVAVSLAWVVHHVKSGLRQELEQLESRLALDFDHVVTIPSDLPDKDETGDGLSKADFELARIDAWVLTHELFEGLKSGKVDRDYAVMILRQYGRSAKDDEIISFPNDYQQVGDNPALFRLIRGAVSNLVQSARQEAGR